MTTDFPLQIEFTYFAMGLARNFHGKKGGPEIFCGLKGGGQKNVCDNIFCIRPPLQVFVNGPLGLHMKTYSWSKIILLRIWTIDIFFVHFSKIGCTTKSWLPWQLQQLLRICSLQHASVFEALCWSNKEHIRWYSWWHTREVNNRLRCGLKCQILLHRKTS